MCLRAKQTNIVSGEDIRCWKMVKRTWFGRLTTPFRKAFISKKMISGKVDFVAQGDEYREPLTGWDGYPRYDVRGGYIHAYLDYDVAMNNMRCMNDGLKRPLFYVTKCIVPAGTPYCMSWDEAEIAAKKIRFTDSGLDDGTRVIFPGKFFWRVFRKIFGGLLK